MAAVVAVVLGVVLKPPLMMDGLLDDNGGGRGGLARGVKVSPGGRRGPEGAYRYVRDCCAGGLLWMCALCWIPYICHFHRHSGLLALATLSCRPECLSFLPFVAMHIYAHACSAQRQLLLSHPRLGATARSPSHTSTMP